MGFVQRGEVVVVTARGQSGASHFEVILLICLILVLVGTLLKMLFGFYQGSEQMQFEATLERLNGSINTLVVEHISKGDINGLLRYQGYNPMQLLSSDSINYSGEFSLGEHAPEPASWYFNRTSRKLIYQVREQSKVSKQGGHPSQLSFQLILQFQDHNQNQRFDLGVDAVSGLILKSDFPYQWLKPE